MTGWRIGYAAGPEWLISAMAKVQSQTASSPCTPAQFAAAAAMTSDQSLVGQWRSIMATRRDLALRALQDCTRLSIVAPQGAFYIFAGVGACLGLRTPQGQTLENDTQVCEYLLDAASVATVPGAAFHASPFVRLSFALEESRLAEACRRIVQALDALTD
jgi:aspartate aminotransferase